MSFYVTSLTKSQHVKLVLRRIAKVMMILSSWLTTIRTGKRRRNRNVLKPYCSLYGVSCSAPNPVSFSISQGVSALCVRVVIAVRRCFAFCCFLVAALVLTYRLFVFLGIESFARSASGCFPISAQLALIKLAPRFPYAAFCTDAPISHDASSQRKSLWQSPFCRQTKRVPEAVIPIMWDFSFRLASA